MSTPTPPPLWRQAYNAWEQVVNPGLQQVTASNGFRDLLAMGMKANADLTREIERASRQWLHLWNLPAASDVRRLRQQISALERQLMAMRNELERQEAERTAATASAADHTIEMTTLTTADAAANGSASNGRKAPSTNGSRTTTTAA